MLRSDVSFRTADLSNCHRVEDCFQDSSAMLGLVRLRLEPLMRESLLNILMETVFLQLSDVA